MTRRVSLKPYLSLSYVMYLNSDMYPFLSSKTYQTQASIWVKIGLLQPSLETVVPEGVTPNLQLLSMLQEDKVRPFLIVAILRLKINEETSIRSFTITKLPTYSPQYLRSTMLHFSLRGLQIVLVDWYVLKGLDMN